MSGDDVVWFDGLVTGETPACWLVEVDGQSKLIPESQMRDGSDSMEEGEDVTVGIPAWLAEKQGIKGRPEK